MRNPIATVGFLALFASVAFGQTVSNTSSERTFQLTGGESPQAIQEMVNTVRSVAMIPQIFQVTGRPSITAQGTLDQIATAAWLIGQLDQPAKGANLIYSAGGQDNIVRIFYVTHAGTPRQLQEIVNATRSVTEIPRITTYNASSAIVMAATQAQAALAEWIVKGLDVAPGRQPAPGQTPVTFAAGQVAQIFYLSHGETPQQTQNIVNVIRSITELQRLTAYSAIDAITLRGTPAQAAAAAWLVSELDKPAPQAAAVDSYVLPGAADGAVRVFYLPGIQTSEALQQAINQIRTTAKLMRIMGYDSSKALALRGTAAQVAMAEQMIQQIAKL